MKLIILDLPTDPRSVLPGIKSFPSINAEESVGLASSVYVGIVCYKAIEQLC